MAMLEQNRTLWIAFYIIVGLALFAGAYLAVLSARGAPDVVIEEKPNAGATAVILEGTYVCLPRIDDTASAECTPGIQMGEQYYALDLALLLGSGTVTNFSPGMQILAAGEIISLEDIPSEQWDIYPVEGVMQVVEVARN